MIESVRDAITQTLMKSVGNPENFGTILYSDGPGDGIMDYGAFVPIINKTLPFPYLSAKKPVPVIAVILTLATLILIFITW